MKFFVIALFGICMFMRNLRSANGEFTAEKYKQIHNTCVAQSGVSEEVIERARKGDFDPDPKLTHFLKCCFEQEDALNADGTINVEKLLASLHDVLIEKFEKPIKECLIEVPHSGDTLDYIGKYCYCIYEKTHDKFDIP